VSVRNRYGAIIITYAASARMLNKLIVYILIFGGDGRGSVMISRQVDTREDGTIPPGLMVTVARWVYNVEDERWRLA
jgi:hypothetical protein